MWGYKTSGPAVIDPDGEGGLPPFKVYCDMDSDPSTGITVVDHQYEVHKSIDDVIFGARLTETQTDIVTNYCPLRWYRDSLG